MSRDNADSSAARLAGAKRLFFGISVGVIAEPLRVRTQMVRNWLELNLSDVEVAWIAPARYHITLKYLGWTRPEAIAAIRSAATVVLAKQSTYRLKLGQLGGFDSLASAQVLFAEVEVSTVLTNMVKALDEACAEIGFPAELRPFHPHVTLARFRKVANLRDLDIGSSQETEQKNSVWDSSSLQLPVNSIHLYESPLISDVFEYPKLASWKLHE